MKQVIPIFIGIVILVLRQAPSAFGGENLPGSSPILKEVNVSMGTQGLGWFEDIEKGDPGLLDQVFQPFQNEEPLFVGAAVWRHFRFSFHFHTNPLLIDRPPPVHRA